MNGYLHNILALLDHDLAGGAAVADSLSVKLRRWSIRWS